MAATSEATREFLAAGWLAAIVESSDDAIVSKTLDGIITSWNPAAERLFGYTAKEMIGRPIAILAAPDHENEMPLILERIRRGEKVEHFETVRRRKDGSLVDISLTVSPIRDQSGQILGASKIARDITQHKRAEQALLESEARFRNLANTVPDIVWTAAPDGTITFVNDRGFHFCGLMPGENRPELAGAGAAPRGPRALPRAVARGAAAGDQLRDRGPHPTVRW